MKKKTIEEINREIEELFKERASLLSETNRQFVEVYTVYNHETGKVDDNTFVLNPLKKRDLDFLQAYAESLKDGVLKLSLLDWLKEYSAFRCIRDRICKKTGTPVCCAHCSELQVCMSNNAEGLCPSVEIGDVLVVSDCIDED